MVSPEVKAVGSGVSAEVVWEESETLIRKKGRIFFSFRGSFAEKLRKDWKYFPSGKAHFQGRTVNSLEGMFFIELFKLIGSDRDKTF